MARKARPGLGTVAKFIAIDDDALGGDPATLGARYAEYIRTTNRRVLEVDPDKSPSYYHLRPLDTRQMQRLNGLLVSTRNIMVRRLEALKAAETGGIVVPLSGQEKHEEQEVDQEYVELRREILDECLLACDQHKIVTEVDEGGDTIYEEVHWLRGTPRPAGLLDSIVNDTILVDNMIHFLLRFSSLTEKEKKQ